MTSLELREKAARYRQLAVGIADPQAVNALCDLAEEYEAVAAKLEAGDKSFPEES